MWTSASDPAYRTATARTGGGVLPQGGIAWPPAPSKGRGQLWSALLLLAVGVVTLAVLAVVALAIVLGGHTSIKSETRSLSPSASWGEEAQDASRSESTSTSRQTQKPITRRYGLFNNSLITRPTPKPMEESRGTFGDAERIDLSPLEGISVLSNNAKGVPHVEISTESIKRTTPTLKSIVNEERKIISPPFGGSYNVQSSVNFAADEKEKKLVAVSEESWVPEEDEEESMSHGPIGEAVVSSLQEVLEEESAERLPARSYSGVNYSPRPRPILFPEISTKEPEQSKEVPINIPESVPLHNSSQGSQQVLMQNKEKEVVQSSYFLESLSTLPSPIKLKTIPPPQPTATITLLPQDERLSLQGNKKNEKITSNSQLNNKPEIKNSNKSLVNVVLMVKNPADVENIKKENSSEKIPTLTGSFNTEDPLNITQIFKPLSTNTSSFQNNPVLESSDLKQYSPISLLSSNQEVGTVNFEPKILVPTLPSSTHIASINGADPKELVPTLYNSTPKPTTSEHMPQVVILPQTVTESVPLVSNLSNEPKELVETLLATQPSSQTNPVDQKTMTQVETSEPLDVHQLNQEIMSPVELIPTTTSSHVLKTLAPLTTLFPPPNSSNYPLEMRTEDETLKEDTITKIFEPVTTFIPPSEKTPVKKEPNRLENKEPIEYVAITPETLSTQSPHLTSRALPTTLVGPTLGSILRPAGQRAAEVENYGAVKLGLLLREPKSGPSSKENMAFPKSEFISVPAFLLRPRNNTLPKRIKEIEVKQTTPNCTCADRLQAQGLGRKLCDGVVDCWDYSDETSCEWCEPGHHVCAHSRACVAHEKLCDGRRDCPFGDDERACVSVAPDPGRASTPRYFSDGLLMVRQAGDWGPLCVEKLDGSAWRLGDVARAVCRALTYSDFELAEQVTDVGSKGPYFELNFERNNGTRSTPRLAVRAAECSSHAAVRLGCRDLQCGVRPLAVSQWARASRGRASRIVGGGNAGPGAWPWQAALYKEGQFQCGGSLIASQWLLSASHCFAHALDAYWVARLGALRRGTDLPSPFEQLRRVSRILQHPGYLDTGFINDLALLKLEKPVDFSDYVRPVCLPTSALMPVVESKTEDDGREGQMCTVVGWGQLSEVGRIFPDTLQEVQLPIISTEECRRRTLFLPLYRVTEDMFCAGFDRGGRDACLGDSGGPLMCQRTDGHWELTGITSNGYGCARAHRPGVYTKVANYMDWISAVLENISIDGDNDDLDDSPGKCESGHRRCALGQCLPVMPEERCDKDFCPPPS